MSLPRNTPLSRILALALLLGLLASVYLLVVTPLRHHYRESNDAIAYLTRQVASYERIAKSRDEIESLFASMRPEQEAQGYYLKGATRALASAELQTYARTIIEAAEGSLVSTQPILRGEREPERMVSITVRMSGTIESLVQVFHRIANGVPVLLTDEVMIRQNRSTLSRQGEEGNGGELDIQFTLTGFVKESVS